jgi:hypothetical protein
MMDSVTIGAERDEAEITRFALELPAHVSVMLDFEYPESVIGGFRFSDHPVAHCLHLVKLLSLGMGGLIN